MNNQSSRFDVRAITLDLLHLIHSNRQQPEEDDCLVRGCQAFIDKNVESRGEAWSIVVQCWSYSWMLYFRKCRKCWHLRLLSHDGRLSGFPPRSERYPTKSFRRKLSRPHRQENRIFSRIRSQLKAEAKIQAQHWHHFNTSPFIIWKKCTHFIYFIRFIK